MTQSILQHMHPDDLVPYYNNPRHNQDAVGPVAESIKAFGFKVQIVVDENMEVITGRTCYVNELDPQYVDVIIRRWENLTGEKAVKLHG